MSLSVCGPTDNEPAQCAVFLGGGGLQGPIVQVIRPCLIAELSVKRLCHGQQKEKRAWHP